MTWLAAFGIAAVLLLVGAMFTSVIIGLVFWLDRFPAKISIPIGVLLGLVAIAEYIKLATR